MAVLLSHGDAHVVGNAVNPGGQFCVASKTTQGSINFDEHLLSRVLGVFTPSKEMQGLAVDSGGVFRHERSEFPHAILDLVVSFVHGTESTGSVVKNQADLFIRRRMAGISFRSGRRKPLEPLSNT